MKKIKNSTGRLTWKNSHMPYMAYTVSDFILVEDICLDTMQLAVNDALIAIPRMAYSCVLDRDELYCVENLLPLEVQRTQTPLLPDGENVNGHMFSFSIWENKLTIICHHSLTDGIGAKFFINYILRRYEELMAGNAPAVTGPLYDVDLMNEELDITKLDYPKDFQPDPPAPSCMVYRQPAHDNCYTTDSFCISEDAFMQYVKFKKTSPAIALCALMTKQFLDSTQESDAVANCNIISNIRSLVGIEKTLTNCVNSTLLSVTRADTEKENFMESLRECFKRRSSSDYVFYTLHAAANKELKNRMSSGSLFTVSYTGKVEKSDRSLVKQSNIYRFVNYFNIIDMKSVEGRFNISVSGDNRSNPITDMLKNAFREIGLEIYEETKTMVTPENGMVTIEKM